MTKNKVAVFSGTLCSFSSRTIERFERLRRSHPTDQFFQTMKSTVNSRASTSLQSRSASVQCSKHPVYRTKTYSCEIVRVSEWNENMYWSDNCKTGEQRFLLTAEIWSVYQLPRTASTLVSEHRRLDRNKKADKVAKNASSLDRNWPHHYWKLKSNDISNLIRQTVFNWQHPSKAGTEEQYTWRGLQDNGEATQWNVEFAPHTSSAPLSFVLWHYKNSKWS